MMLYIINHKPFIFSITLSLVSGDKIFKLKGGKPGDVPFPHEDHKARLNDCGICHKFFPQVKGALQKNIAEKKLKKKQVMAQCKDCHKENAKSGKRSGPVKCKECHVK